MQLLSLCIVALLLAGCGRKETTPAKQTESAPAALSAIPRAPDAAHSGPVVVCFGDSLTAGVAGRSYPEQLQELLDGAHLDFRVDNQGVSGDTTTDGLARIGNVIVAKPVLVILEFGGNDGLRGTPVDATRKNLESMITSLRAAKLETVLLGITLPPNYGAEYVQAFTGMFPALAKQYRLPLIPFLLQNVYRDSSLMQPDGIHPNGEGNHIVAQNVYDLIVPLLKNRRAQP